MENEHQLQSACIKWFEHQYPKHAMMLWAIPNANLLIQKIPESQRMRVWSYMKAEGLRKGVPDLFLAIPRGVYHGFFIEMKIKGNYPSVEQRRYHQLLSANGYRMKVINSFEQFMSEVSKYLSH